MGVLHHIAEQLSPIVDFVYPPRCPACGEGLGSQDGLCLPCWSALRVPPPTACKLCAEPPRKSEAGRAIPVCTACIMRAPPHDALVAGCYYDEVPRKLLLAFKHGRKIALARLLARLMAGRIPPTARPRLLVPVPLHRWRLWQRGYNQSALLARELARMGAGTVMVDGLIRTRRTKPLGRLPRSEREGMLKNAVAVNPARLSALQDADVLLIDDVVTTGATGDACVAALKRGGVRTVTICCVAKRTSRATEWTG